MGVSKPSLCSLSDNAMDQKPLDTIPDVNTELLNLPVSFEAVS